MEYALLGWAEPAPDAGAAAPAADGDRSNGERARDGPRLRLDWRAFAYAGKFVLPETGKAVARDAGTARPTADDWAGAELPLAAGSCASGDAGTDQNAESTADRSERSDALDDVDPTVVGAVAFSPDRTDPAVLSLRYVSVRRDSQGSGVGPRLLAFVSARAGDRGYERVRIAVNNPRAYVAAAKAGFAFAGRETGIAELVCERAAGGTPGRPAPETYAAGLRRFADRDADGEAAQGTDRSGPAFAAERLERGPPAPVEVPGPDPGARRRR